MGNFMLIAQLANWYWPMIGRKKWMQIYLNVIKKKYWQFWWWVCGVVCDGYFNDVRVLFWIRPPLFLKWEPQFACIGLVGGCWIYTCVVWGWKSQNSEKCYCSPIISTRHSAEHLFQLGQWGTSMVVPIRMKVSMCYLKTETIWWNNSPTFLRKIYSEFFPGYSWLFFSLTKTENLFWPLIIYLHHKFNNKHQQKERELWQWKIGKTN